MKDATQSVYRPQTCLPKLFALVTMNKRELIKVSLKTGTRANPEVNILDEPKLGDILS